MTEPPKKKPKQEKKPKLNIHAKALFIRHTPRTIKKYPARVSDYLKFPKISKGFLFAANSHRIFSLELSSFSDQKYKTALKIQDIPLVGKYYALFTSSFEQLKNLSKWLHIEFLDIWFSLGPVDFNKQIHAFRRVWTELYPNAKINFSQSSCSNYGNPMSNLLEELSERVHSFKHSFEVLMKVNTKLNLNECVLGREIDMDDFKKLMQKEHKIKKLKFYLRREYSSADHDLEWEKPLPIQKHLDDFPTNFAPKELKIKYEIELRFNKIFDVKEIEALLAFFPNLTKFELKLKYDCDVNYGGRKSVKIDFKKDVKKSSEIAMNFIHELRLLLAQKRPSLELECKYSFCVLDAEKVGFEVFEEWAKTLPAHPELNGIEKFGPVSDPEYYSDYGFKEGDYYNIVDGYHIISLNWKHQNFAGAINVLVGNYREY